LSSHRPRPDISVAVSGEFVSDSVVMAGFGRRASCGPHVLHPACRFGPGTNSIRSGNG
jgi:hypothetical protein